MIDSLMSFIGMSADVAFVSDETYFIILSSLFLFAVAETFRLFEIVIDRLTKGRG